ncbi:DegT/DnrJ/EryC1/StrS aminotransferase family protein [Flavobacterium plurextorum]|uniref:DegT/DnrJ/EryC1/StrS family aminotransferase n=1 Tax=Flavobacterium TaxID=237 RepID=UPI00214DDF17|nr:MULTISPECIES: DegT/DnrJ/EryC1/StrS aminotransferase family protein [Flavobacterium]UUW09502.1 DegT/DnrJ/EryC1/StrS aminotransferase family protein [Flavobacterium plurextorum]
MFKIPVYQPLLNGNEKKYVNECLDSTWISSKGRFINDFENSFSEYINVKHSTTVSNGTVAIHLALLALGIGEGDEVIVPTLTYIASVNSIAYTGAKPVFVDSLADSWQIDSEDVRRKITPNTKAVMAVHLYGHPCDMDALLAICKEHNLFLIEDCAEAIGTTYKGKHVGTFGDISTFSFFGNKTITTGEGGMVVTNDDTLYDRAVHFKGQGLAKHRQYWHDVIGYNYRMTNICAAIGLAQMENIDTVLKQKAKIADTYKSLLKDTSVEFHDSGSKDVYHSYWMCSILLKDAKERENLRKHLDENGIETRPLFYPVHTMPMYSDKYQRHPIAENIGWRGINLPSYPGLTDEDIRFICDKIKEVVS